MNRHEGYAKLWRVRAYLAQTYFVDGNWIDASSKDAYKLLYKLAVDLPLWERSKQAEAPSE